MEENKEEKKNNPLMDSYLELIEIEFKETIKQAFLEMQIQLGDDFDSTMADIAADISTLQGKSKLPEGISYVSAGLLLLFPETKEQGQSPEWKQYTKLINAAICWGIYHGLNEKDKK